MERMNQQEIPIMQKRMSNVNTLVTTPNSPKVFIYSFAKIRLAGIIVKGTIVALKIMHPLSGQFEEKILF